MCKVKSKQVILGLALCAIGLSAGAADTGKNCYDVLWGLAGNDYAKMIREKTDEWNFQFRPYGEPTDWLLFDSNTKRDVAGGASSNQKVTALRVSCDPDGFDILVYCTEPGLATYLEQAGGAYPREQIEYFVVPGDADTPAVQRHYMGFYGAGRDCLYPNLVHDRWYRDAKPTITETPIPGAVVVRMHYDWRLFWDLVPAFPKKADNFWRLSIIRWNCGGVTWGGSVHQNSQAGYIRWPAFTAEQRAALLKRTLEKGYEEFLALATTDNRLAVGGRTPLKNWRFRRELDEKYAHSYVNVNCDPVFRKELEAMVEERKALGPQIAKIGELSDAEQEKFYMEAAAKLFNYRYDVQDAYARFLEKGINGEKGSVENGK